MKWLSEVDNICLIIEEKSRKIKKPLKLYDYRAGGSKIPQN